MRGLNWPQESQRAAWRPDWARCWPWAHAGFQGPQWSHFRSSSRQVTRRQTLRQAEVDAWSLLLPNLGSTVQG